MQKQDGKIKKQLTNGQASRMLNRFGSGSGRFWNSYLRGTAISDKRGWYIERKRYAR